MSIFEDMFECLDWKYKVRGQPPQGASVLHTWPEPAFRHANRVLARLRGETKNIYHTLHIYEHEGQKILSVTRNRYEKEKKNSRTLDPELAALVAGKKPSAE